jgi:hypothetical protein
MSVTATDKEQLLVVVPFDGSAIGNTTLMRRLGWGEQRYWPVRDALIAEGVIERHRGRGGAVRRVSKAAPEVEEPVPPEVVAEVVADSYTRELQLYEPLRDTIATDWAKDRLSSPIAVEVTAQQGRRQTGGRWSRPDIVAVEVKTFLYVPGKHLNVTTFEVKPSDAIDVSAVYEALAHRRSATHAYLVLHVPDESVAELEPVVEEVCRVARSHGVGVITVADPGRYETWDEREEAVRFDPDPERLDHFIVTQFSRRTADAVARALR